MEKAAYVAEWLFMQYVLDYSDTDLFLILSFHPIVSLAILILWYSELNV